jgi:hypothetical protein
LLGESGFDLWADAGCGFDVVSADFPSNACRLGGLGLSMSRFSMSSSIIDRGRLLGDERGSVEVVAFFGEGRLTGGAKAAEKVGLVLLLDCVSTEIDVDLDGTLGVNENGMEAVTLSLEPLVTGCLETSLEGGGRKTENFGGCWKGGGCTTIVLGAMD